MDEKDNNHLVDQLQSPDSLLRLQALHSLEELDLVSIDNRVFDGVVANLTCSDAKVKEAALDLLCNTTYSKAGFALKKHILIENDPLVLARIIDVMDQFTNAAVESTEVSAKVTNKVSSTALLETLIAYLEKLIPHYHFSASDIPPFTEDDSLLYYLQDYILTEDICVYVDRFQYEASDFNALAALNSENIKVSDDALYDNNDQLIDVDSDPHELFIEHFNQQLEEYDLILIDIFNHENPSYVCVSTTNKKNLRDFYQFLNDADFY